MLHGGLRYLAAGDFKTTRQSVQEREYLSQYLPELAHPISYILPHYQKKYPPAWLFRWLLRGYDFFAKKRYWQPWLKAQVLEAIPGLKQEQLQGGSRFIDSLTDDSRLVMRVLQEAKRHGAELLSYHKVVELVHNEQGQVCAVQVLNQVTQEQSRIDAKVVVNATGAWTDAVRQLLVTDKAQQPEPKIRPSRGSHWVLERQALPIQVAVTLIHPRDKRPIFILPWMGATVVGTTDVDHPDIEYQKPCMSWQEHVYLLEVMQAYFPDWQFKPEHLLSTYSGVRPLLSSGAHDPSKEKRSHSIWHEQGLISVSGGKLTTFRQIAMDVLKEIQKIQPQCSLNTKQHAVFESRQLTKERLAQTPLGFQYLDAQVQQRLYGYYGQDFLEFIEQDSEKNELLFLPEAYFSIGNTPYLWVELIYLIAQEHIVHLDDLLLRRTHLGLLLPQGGEAEQNQIRYLFQRLLGWSEQQWLDEWQRYAELIQHEHAMPQP